MMTTGTKEKQSGAQVLTEAMAAAIPETIPGASGTELRRPSC